MTNQPVLLSEALTGRALSDARFFTQLPEYALLKAKMQAMRADLTQAAGGCSNCRRRRVVRSLFSDFVAVTLSLSGEGLSRLKVYLGVQGLLLNQIDPTTGRAQTRLL